MPGPQTLPEGQAAPGGGTTNAVTGFLRTPAQCPAVPNPNPVPFWNTKLAVHHAKPLGRPFLSRSRLISHVPGPMPTGGLSTPGADSPVLVDAVAAQVPSSGICAPVGTGGPAPPLAGPGREWECA